MSTDYGADNRHDDDLPSVDRLLALSDGVVAIALTLLVLQLAVPVIRDAGSPSSLAAALGGRGDRLTSYAISFYVIAQFWLVHHKVYRRIVGQREGLAWWNFAFLFTITVMPFTSDLLGEYSENPLAVVIFAGNLLLATLATQATVMYAKHARLLAPAPAYGPQSERAGQLRALGTVLVVLISIGLAWVNTDLAKYSWLLMALVPALVERLVKPPPGAAESGPPAPA
jgi:uncharacterized membrane protein